MTDVDPTPINVGHTGCPAMVRVNVGQFASCPGEPTHAALTPRGVRVFPCGEHASLTQLRDVAPMTDEDRAELDGRRVQEMRAMAGLRYERVGPADLAD